MRSRFPWLAIALFLLLAGGVYAQSAQNQSTAGLSGAVYTPPVPASDFILTDQHGVYFHMADMAGKVVVFSFLYTHCTDICPYIALKLKVAYGLLGTDAKRVGIVAVTTDPQRDTIPVIASYSKEMGLFDIWHFVTGSLVEVRAVWGKYLANATASSAPTTKPAAGASASAEKVEHGQGLGAGDLAVASKVISKFSGGYEVAHFAAFHIIDKRGRIRVTLDQDALPSEIVANVRILLAEP